MSKLITGLVAASFAALVAGCAQEVPQEEYVVVQPEPISVEPVYTGKYK